jgi:hypothetical protein
MTITNIISSDNFQSTQNNDVQARIRRNAQAERFVVMAKNNGGVGVAAYNPLATGKKDSVAVKDMPEGYDAATAAMGMTVACIKQAIETVKDGQKADIYAPAENAIRIRTLFSRMKDGETESLSEEDVAKIVEFRGDDKAQLYVSAVDQAYALLQKAKAENKYIQIHTLDDIQFTRLPEAVAKNWKLSGIEVTFKNGKATIPAGTKMSDGTLTTAPIVIDGKYIAGNRKLSVRAINGNQGHKELVALKDARYSRDTKILQGMRLSLLTAMPAEKSEFELAFEAAEAAKAQA